MTSARLKLTLAAAVAVMCLLATSVPAQGAALPGPRSLSVGLSDATAFESSPATDAFWFGRAQSLGSGFVRLDASWSGVAPAHPSPGFKPTNPADPGYQWGVVDDSVRAAAAHHQIPVILAFGAPAWAAGPDRPASINPAIWWPNAADFGAFARALAKRYSGHFPDPLHRGRSLPRVRYFQAWNEPNLSIFLMPQWAATSTGGWQAVSPGIYRSLLNSFYAAVKSVQHDSVVITAGTASAGDPPATGLGRMAPVTFLEGLMCLTPALHAAKCPHPPHFDALDHHPYSAAPFLPLASPNDVGVADIGKIWRIVHAAERLHRVLPATAKSLWATEIHWTSSPPSTPAEQARYLALGLFWLWRANVTHVAWFFMFDRPSTAGNALYDTSGRAKPAAAAFHFPFVAVAARHHQVALWGRAPHAGSVLIQKLVRGRWRKLLRVRTTSGGIFYASRRLGSHLRLRAVSRRAVSPVWTTP